MAFHSIPNDFRTYLFQGIPFKIWRDFFQKEKDFQEYIKGFRPTKVPKKILQNVVEKLLEENPGFREKALKLWLEEKESPFPRLDIEHLQRNFHSYLHKLGKKAFFWHLLAQERQEWQDMAWKILDDEEKNSRKAFPEVLYTEEDLKKIKREILAQVEERFQALQEAWEEKEQQWEIREKELLLDNQKWQEKYNSLEKKWHKEKEKNKELLTRLEDREKKIEELKKELEKSKKEFPIDFQPCSLVLHLEKELRNLTAQFSKISEKDLALESLKAQLEEEKKVHAEILQQLRELTEEKEKLQQELSHLKAQKDKLRILEIQQPTQVSQKKGKDKVLWPKQPHHYPRRLEAFLDKITKIPYIDTIQFKTFENTSHSRIKGIDSEGNIILLYSDGQKGVKMIIQTTASHEGEGAYIVQEIQKLDPSIL